MKLTYFSFLEWKNGTLTEDSTKTWPDVKGSFQRLECAGHSPNLEWPSPAWLTSLVSSQPDLIFLSELPDSETLCPEWLCITSPGQGIGWNSRPSKSLALPGCGREHFLPAHRTSQNKLWTGSPSRVIPPPLAVMPSWGMNFSCFCPVESVCYVSFSALKGGAGSAFPDVKVITPERVYIFFHFSETHLSSAGPYTLTTFRAGRGWGHSIYSLLCLEGAG